MRRVGSLTRSRLAAFAFVLLIAAPASAQDPVPPDTLRPDTTRIAIPPEAVASDTLPGDSLMPQPADSVGPAPGLPGWEDPLRAGWAFGRWEWTRDELLRYRGLTLLDLLERLPGLHSIRAGAFGREAGLSAAGLGGAAIRIFIDGYELDPLGQPYHELQQYGLIDLEKVRAERTAAGLRVDLTTFRLPDSRAYSEVEAAAGNYGTRVLRGTISRVAGSRSTVTGSYDHAATSGVGIAEAFLARGAALRWAYQLAPRTGLQLELRQSGAQREGSVAPVDHTRRDVTLRGRSELFPGLTVEGLVGRTTWRDDRAVPEPSAAVPDTVLLNVARTQGQLRALWDTPVLDLEGTARLRTSGGGVPTPGSELALRGSLRPFAGLLGEGSVSTSAVGGATVTTAHAGARLGPLAGLSLFGSLTAGDRWSVLARDTSTTYLFLREDTVDGVPVTVEEERTRVQPVFVPVLGTAAGARAGVEWSALGAVLGLAGVTLADGSVTPFGLAFDRRIEPLPVGAARGLEGHASIPLPWTERTVRLMGSGSVWAETGGRPYLPEREARLALEYHEVRIEGQFEPTIRIEAVHRGRTYVPTADGTAFGFVTEPYTTLNFFMQLRILDVRAFLLWENPTHNRLALDLPDGVGFQPGQRIVYGARWWFRN